MSGRVEQLTLAVALNHQNTMERQLPRKDSERSVTVSTILSKV